MTPPGLAAAAALGALGLFGLRLLLQFLAGTLECGLRRRER